MAGVGKSQRKQGAKDEEAKLDVEEHTGTAEENQLPTCSRPAAGLALPLHRYPLSCTGLVLSMVLICLFLPSLFHYSLFILALSSLFVQLL
jgi:hypothetical protein